jgi:hypothetical protein
MFYALFFELKCCYEWWKEFIQIQLNDSKSMYYSSKEVFLSKRNENKNIEIDPELLLSDEDSFSELPEEDLDILSFFHNQIFTNRVNYSFCYLSIYLFIN